MQEICWCLASSTDLSMEIVESKEMCMFIQWSNNVKIDLPNDFLFVGRKALLLCIQTDQVSMQV